jgi:NADH pyrophosphatase-like rudimentary NUDIX domain
MDICMAYCGCILDRATRLRADTAWLADRLREPSTRIVAVWRDRSLIAAGNRLRLLALTAELAETAISLAHEVVFRGPDEDGPAWFACDFSHQEEERLSAIDDGGAFQDLGAVVTALAADEAALWLTHGRLPTGECPLVQQDRGRRDSLAGIAIAVPRHDRARVDRSLGGR